MAYGKKTEKNKFMYITISIIILIAIIYLFFNIVDGWRKYKESNKRLEASLSSFTELTQQYEELKKVKALEESTTGYEMHIRSKFDFRKPDENVVFIISEDVPKEIPEDKGINRLLHTFKNFFN